jgi:hypothetical protein
LADADGVAFNLCAWLAARGERPPGFAGYLAHAIAWANDFADEYCTGGFEQPGVPRALDGPARIEEALAGLADATQRLVLRFGAPQSLEFDRYREVSIKRSAGGDPDALYDLVFYVAWVIRAPGKGGAAFLADGTFWEFGADGGASEAFLEAGSWRRLPADPRERAALLANEKWWESPAAGRLDTVDMGAVLHDVEYLCYESKPRSPRLPWEAQ